MRIYFGPAMFDRITRDKKVKFQDKLGAVGGTMGLLTGFSIVSGVEIVYYLLKIIASLLNTNN